MKNKKAETNIMEIMLGAIILIFLSVAFINVASTSVASQTQLATASNEQYNLLTSGCYSTQINNTGQVNESNPACNITVANWYNSGNWRLSESVCYLSGVSVANNTGTALTAGTDYIVYPSSGLIQILNTTNTANTSATLSNNLIDTGYSYCGNNYLIHSSDRGLASLWILFMIITLLGALIAIVLKIMKG